MKLNEMKDLYFGLDEYLEYDKIREAFKITCKEALCILESVPNEKINEIISEWIYDWKKFTGLFEVDCVGDIQVIYTMDNEYRDYEELKMDNSKFDSCLDNLAKYNFVFTKIIFDLNNYDSIKLIFDYNDNFLSDDKVEELYKKIFGEHFIDLLNSGVEISTKFFM